MPKTFRFTVPVTGIDEEAPVYCRMYQSDTLIGDKTVLATETLLTIGYTSTPPETLDWEIATADGTKHYWLVLMTASQVESLPAYLAPETTTGTVTLEVLTENAIGTVVQDVRFRATPLRKGAGVSGVKTVILKGEDVTDANGFASLTLYADSGAYNVELVGYSNIRFDTTGRSGTIVNYATEL